MSTLGFREAFEALVPDAAAPAWLGDLRREAFQHFEAAGFPTRRQEAWRYTNVSAIAETTFELGSDAGEDASVTRAVNGAAFGETAATLVFVDGRFAPDLSRTLPEVATSLSVSWAGGSTGRPGPLGELVDPKLHPFAALNTAFLCDAARIEVPQNVTLEKPIHLIFVATPGARRVHHPRILVGARASSRATVVADFVSASPEVSFCNAVTEIEVGPGANLDFVLCQRETSPTFHVSNLAARVDRDARLATHTLCLGGNLVRNDLQVRLVAEGAECRMNGLYLGTDRERIDNYTEVCHEAPHGTSAELYKGILAGSSHGVFRGRVIVAPDAQKTDARQQNPNLLLGAGAEVNSRPQLEIRADDVKCSHGSTVGRLDEEAIFYLRSRGVGTEHARTMLGQAFAAEIVDAVPDQGLRDALLALITARLWTTGEAS
ncbi:MAG: Fe-S cluster assembly protein SufD [Myxococcota bacterium]|jgi:Fe-S cluster assembly protein SufD